MSDTPQSPMPENNDPGPAPQRLSIRINDDKKYGVYSNVVVVSHSPHDFTLDFCQLMPGADGGLQAEVVSRVKIAPTMVGKMIQTLNSNLTGYEDKFGLVKEIG